MTSRVQGQKMGQEDPKTRETQDPRPKTQGFSLTRTDLGRHSGVRCG